MTKKVFLLVLLSVLAFPVFVSAQTDPTNPFQGMNMQSPINSLEEGVDLLSVATQWIYTIFFIVAIIYILLAAYSFVTSKGDQTKVGKAKKQLLYAVIAIAIALLSYTTVLFVRNTLESNGSGNPNPPGGNQFPAV